MKLSVSHLVLGLSLLAHSFALPTQQASCDVHHNPLLGLMELPWNKPEAFAFCKHMLGLDQPIIQTLWRTTTQLHTTTITTTSTQVVPVTVRSGDDGFAPPAWIPWAYRGYEMVQGTCGCLMQGVSRSTKVVTAWKTASTTTTKHQTMTQTVRSTVHTSGMSHCDFPQLFVMTDGSFSATTTTSTKPSSQSSSSTPTPGRLLAQPVFGIFSMHGQRQPLLSLPRQAVALPPQVLSRIRWYRLRSPHQPSIASDRLSHSPPAT
jgi:hypothetical protein